MKPVIAEEDAIHFVSESQMVQFIHENAPMEWNAACDFIRENNISGCNGEPSYWRRSNVFKGDENKINIKWMRHFFEAHPFFNKIMIVFDD